MSDYLHAVEPCPDRHHATGTCRMCGARACVLKNGTMAHHRPARPMLNDGPGCKGGSLGPERDSAIPKPEAGERA